MVAEYNGTQIDKKMTIVRSNRTTVLFRPVVGLSNRPLEHAAYCCDAKSIHIPHCRDGIAGTYFGAGRMARFIRAGHGWRPTAQGAR
jgi:hypothetical protein